MARKRRTSPVLQLTIGQDQIDRAVQSNSGGCLIADAIKTQYPELTGVTVNMATIRVSDRKRGERYTYLTPPAAQHVLLAFDQGWPNPADHLTIERAVQINPIVRARSPERRAARIDELRKAAATRDLTRAERAALTRMSKPGVPPSSQRISENPRRARPASHPPAEIHSERGQVQVRGGPPRVQGPAHPNLLAGRDRHFGAKLADPGIAFREAVEAAVAERLAAGEPPS